MIRATITLFFFLIFVKLSAQQFIPHYGVPVNSHCNGFYDYLPAGYDAAGSQKYPLLIALHGVGERGNGTNDPLFGLPLIVLPGKGVASMINTGVFPSSFTVNGNTFRFIVFCPQFTNSSAWPDESDLSAVINYAIGNYKVDLNRIYLAGLSMGAGIAFRYVTSSASHASQIAAIVPVCTALQSGATYASKPDSLACRTITAANLPLWATHNAGDLTVPVSFTDSLEHYINAAPAPVPIARIKVFTSWIYDHDAWTKTFDPAYIGFDGMNIYQWMLQYQRNITPLPVQLKNYRAWRSGPSDITISWQTENEWNNDYFTLERSANGKDFISIAVIKGKNQSSDYRFTDKQPLSDNFYRLSQTDMDGRKTYYEVLRVMTGDTKMEMNLVPNPANNAVKLSFHSEIKEKITVSINGSNGTVVRQWLFNKTAGIFEETLRVNDLPKGTYFFQVKGESFSESMRFIKN